MTPLITRSDLQAFYQISDAIVDDKLNQIIREAMINDLKPLLGRDFFYNVINNVGSHADILNPKSGTITGTDYEHVGLKEVLCHFVYGRLILFGDVISNPFGFTRKLGPRESSENLDYSTKKAIHHDKKSLAYNLWLEVKLYMNLSEYDGYDSCVTKPTRGGGLKITKIG